MRLAVILGSVSVMAAILAASCGTPEHTEGAGGAECSSSSSSSSGMGGEAGAGGEAPDAGGPSRDWCALLDTSDASCMGCGLAPADDEWCANEAAAPCAIVGMVPVACGWSAPADAACIEVGAYACGEMGRLVCCPVDGGPVAVNPACVNGPGDCIDFGDCIDAYCGLDGACYYDRRASGAPCGDGGACGNGICE